MTGSSIVSKPTIPSISSEVKVSEKEYSSRSELILEEEARERDILFQIIRAQEDKYNFLGTRKEAPKYEVHVGNLDWNATKEDLMNQFDGCGHIKNILIPKDRFNGRQKNFAFVEFSCEESMRSALVLDGTPLLNRTIRVTKKRVPLKNGYRYAPY